jgi:hypothetical protein
MRGERRFCLIAIIAGLWVMYASVSAAVFKGKLVDRVTGEGIPNAIVTIDDNNNTINTDENGIFSYESSSDIISVKCTASGYQTAEKRLTSFSDQVFLIEMDPGSSESAESGIQKLDDMTVREKKPEENTGLKSSKEISKIEVAPEQIQKYTSTAENDISRTLQLMPGISAAHENSAGLFLKCMAGRVLINLQQV